MQTNLQQAQIKLNYLAQCAHEGQTVIIAKSGKPYVQLVPVQKPLRQAGALRRKVPDFPFDEQEDYLGGDSEVADLFEKSL